MTRNENNIRAESFADQVNAAIREGDELPDGPVCAAAARTIRTDDIHSHELRLAAEALLASWAQLHDVDRPARS